MEKGEHSRDDHGFSHLFLSKHKSDVVLTFPAKHKAVPNDSTFLLGSRNLHVARDNTSNPVATYPAHKFILCKQSAVFQALFNGPLADSADTVIIEDIKPDIMRELLRFVYRGEINLSGYNIMYCVNAANKYDITGLRERCVTYLIENLDTENACTIYEHACFFHLETLHRFSLDFILQNATDVLKTDDFLGLSYSMLLEIVQSESITADEIDIFKACLKWAENQCKVNKVEKNPENIRSHLGEILHQIRFPTMCKENFQTVVTPTQVLTSEEESLISDYLASTCLRQVGNFVSTERSGRTITVDTCGYKQYRNITLVSCHLCLQVEPESHDSEKDRPLLLLKAVTGSFVPRVLRVYEVQDDKSQNKVPVEEYRSDTNSIVFGKPIEISKRLHLEFQVFSEEIIRNSSGMITVITGTHIYMTRRFYREMVEESVNDVKIVLSQIPMGLTSMSYLKQ